MDCRNAEGTGIKAGAASDAQSRVHDFCPGLRIDGDGALRACRRTQGLGTLLASKGEEPSCFLHPEGSNSRQHRVEGLFMFKGAGQCTGSASDAFFRVRENKVLHILSPKSFLFNFLLGGCRVCQHEIAFSFLHS
jgi:hypothetical protein